MVANGNSVVMLCCGGDRVIIVELVLIWLLASSKKLSLILKQSKRSEINSYSSFFHSDHTHPLTDHTHSLITSQARPKDPDAINKFNECNKIVRQQAFAKAIAVESSKRSIAESIDIDTMG